MNEKVPPGQPTIDAAGIHITNRTTKSKVVAEFVDEIPEPKDNLTMHRRSWVKQDGLADGLQKAVNNPGRALVLLEYDQGSKSERRKLAAWRARKLEEQGYRESMGWTIRAVDNLVYVMFEPVDGGY